MRTALVLSAWLVSCGAVTAPVDAGPDAGPPGAADAGADGGLDAGPRRGVYPDGGSMYRFWDGGACAVKTECPCFSSDDCGPGFTCRSEDSSGTQVWCVPGARGDGGVGAACSLEGDCLSALCVTGGSASQSVCSALCDTAADCAPAVPRCTYIGFGVDRAICQP